MRPLFIAIVFCLAVVSCTKEQPEEPKQDQQISANELDALKKDIDDLKNQIQALTSDGQWAPVSEIEALKKENEELKAQVELLTSGFFEVDGLRFDKNGTLISVPMLESETVKDISGYPGSIKLTNTRSYDAEGRVIQIMDEYSGFNYNMPTVPFY